jgi:GTP-binding protein
LLYKERLILRIVESNFIKSAVKPSQYPDDNFPDIAFAGKSNVGKSSFINTLTGRKLLAKTSNTPGKTRLLNFFRIRFKLDALEITGTLNFVDLPGYGYAKVPLSEKEAWKNMIAEYIKQRKNLAGFIVLVDIRHSADPKDILLLELLKQESIPFCVCATKSDKIGKTKLTSTIATLRKGLGIAPAPIFAVSSLEKSGLEPILEWMYACLTVFTNDNRDN